MDRILPPVELPVGIEEGKVVPVEPPALHKIPADHIIVDGAVRRSSPIEVVRFSIIGVPAGACLRVKVRQRKGEHAVFIGGESIGGLFAGERVPDQLYLRSGQGFPAGSAVEPQHHLVAGDLSVDRRILYLQQFLYCASRRFYRCQIPARRKRLGKDDIPSVVRLPKDLLPGLCKLQHLGEAIGGHRSHFPIQRRPVELPQVILLIQPVDRHLIVQCTIEPIGLVLFCPGIQIDHRIVFGKHRLRPCRHLKPEAFLGPCGEAEGVGLFQCAAVLPSGAGANGDGVLRLRLKFTIAAHRRAEHRRVAVVLEAAFHRRIDGEETVQVLRWLGEGHLQHRLGRYPSTAVCRQRGDHLHRPTKAAGEAKQAEPGPKHCPQ